MQDLGLTRQLAVLPLKVWYRKAWLQAIQVLNRMVERKLAYPDAYMLLGNILETQGIAWQARRIYEQAANLPGLTPQERMFFEMQARRLGGR